MEQAKVTVSGKSIHFTHNSDFCIVVCCATQNNSLDQISAFIAVVSPTLAYTHAKLERVEATNLKRQPRGLKTAT